MVRRNARLRFFVPLAAAFSFACGGSSPSTASLNSAEEDVRSGSASLAAGTASSFAVLGYAAMTCTDGNIVGQVGTNQSTTDVPPGAVALTRCPTSGFHVGDSAAKAAFSAFLARYAALAPKQDDPPCTELSGTLANRTLAPGTYCFPAAATLTGVLTLNGPSTGTWTFKIGSTIPPVTTPPTLPTGALTGTSFSVVMAGGGQACNVTWWVAEAATMTDSNLKGTILAGAAITFTRGTLDGNAYAKAGATVTGTAVTACASAAGGPPACQGKDFVTGGGSIKTDHDKATFAVSGGMRKGGALRGHLTYRDHGWNGPTVKGTGVNSYAVIDATTRRIGGTAAKNGISGFTYELTVSDKGEPGRQDTFAIRVLKGINVVYSASGKLEGGNIQLHVDSSCKGGDDDGDDDGKDDGDDDGHGDGHGGHDEDHDKECGR